MNSFKGSHTLILFMFLVNEVLTDFRNHDSCGLRASKFIVGGTQAQQNEYPFMASLQNLNKGKENNHTCGGSILNERWILTAAHCLEVSIVMKKLKSPTELEIIVGDTDIRKGTTYRVKKWVIHGCYSIEDLKTNDDIALLMTEEEISFDSPEVKPICLPPKNKEPISADITVAGWGVSTETHMLSDRTVPYILQKTNMTIVSQEYCKIYLWFRNMGLFKNMMFSRDNYLCLRAIESTVCRGDSGGPAFQIVNDRIYQFGITSTITPNVLLFVFGNRCYKSNPVQYLKTSHYVDWIKETIDKYADDKDDAIKTKC